MSVDFSLAINALKDQIKAHEDQITVLNQEISAARKGIEALEAINKPAARGELYYLTSRTGGEGHFIERFARDNTTKCSCMAGRFGNQCWAQRYIRESLNRNKYGYVLTVDSFDRRAKPLFPHNYYPSQADRARYGG